MKDETTAITHESTQTVLEHSPGGCYPQIIVGEYRLENRSLRSGDAHIGADRGVFPLVRLYGSLAKI